ncbi:MAG: hypothetical protein WBV94_05090 [Blastocatellia bacterium]
MSEKAYFELNRTFTGAQTNLVRVLAPVTGNLVRAFAYSDTELADGNALFDVNKNGTSIFGDPADRLKIEDGNSTGDVASLEIAVTQYTDVLTVDFDGFTDDAASVGGKLVLVLEFEGAGGGGSAAGCMLVLQNPQAIANNTSSLLVFDDDTVIRDDGGFYDATEDTIAIPADGWYLITGQVRFQASTDGDRFLQLIDSDGNLLGQHRQTHLASAEPHHMQVTYLGYLEASTIIRMYALQDTGGSLDLEVPNGDCWLGIVPAGTM